ncbi:MAG: class I SAM-dependent methyltransferase [Pseudomonadota bacterium]
MTATTMTSTRFWDKTADKYSKQPIGDEKSYARKLTETQRLMRPDMTVLEFGCGTGSTAIAHAGHVAHIDATDFSPEMIAIANQRAKETSTQNVNFQVSGVEEFEAAPESYDMVLMLNLLHLVPDRDAALQKAYRLLKPGGHLVTSTVCLSDGLSLFRILIPIMRLIGKAPFVSFVKAQEMLDLFDATGFEAENHWTHGRGMVLFHIARKPE